MGALINKTLRLFLDGIGRREEYEFYLRRFQGGRTAAFAIVVPDEDSVREAGDVLLFDIQFLLRLELVPVILLAGERADEMAGILAGAEGATEVRPAAHGADAQWLADCRANAVVPILRGGPDPGAALLDLAPSLATRVHLLRTRGGFLAEDGARRQTVYAETEDTTSMAEDDRAVFALCRGLLDRHPGLHLSITSPITLLAELFTVQGSGTLVRRGSVIERPANDSEVDGRRMRCLLESAFRRALVNPDAWRQADTYYIEANYRGAALLQRTAFGDYLAKFAVGTEARGEGLAQELWRQVTDGHPRLFWRSREGNPINAWYKQQADGRHCADGWMVFWRGIPIGLIVDVISYCLDRPEDFERE